MEEVDIYSCEACEHLVSVKHIKVPTFICPACGTINERLTPEDAVGHLEIKSPKLNCEINVSDEGGQVFVKDVDDDFEEALAILTKYGFSMKFIKHDKK